MINPVDSVIHLLNNWTCSSGSGPSDKGGAGYPDPEITGRGGRSPKFFFRPQLVWSKDKEGPPPPPRAPPLGPPLSYIRLSLSLWFEKNLKTTWSISSIGYGLWFVLSDCKVTKLSCFTALKNETLIYYLKGKLYRQAMTAFMTESSCSAYILCS